MTKSKSNFLMGYRHFIRQYLEAQVEVLGTSQSLNMRHFIRLGSVQGRVLTRLLSTPIKEAYHLNMVEMEDLLIWSQCLKDLELLAYSGSIVATLTT